MLLCVAPYVLRVAAVPFRALTLFQSADMSLYLNLSALHPSADGIVTNPWYGIPVSAAESPHFRFGLAFRLFDGVRQLLGGTGPRR
jgi:hypothetical protein